MRAFILSLILPLLMSCAATAVPQTHYNYIPPAAVPATLLPPPPQLGSEAFQHQIAAVIATQYSLGKAELAALRDEQQLRLALITDTVGSSFTAQQFPRSYQLLENVYADTLTIVETDKHYWHTKRPYLIDKRVKLLIDPIDASPAYPSGHTTQSALLAAVLGQLLPNCQTALDARADTIAWHRVQAGVHYPSDLEAGRKLAALIKKALWETPAFQVDFAAAQAEIADFNPICNAIK